MHHAVEMDAPFLLDGQILEEKVHQEGLAAADASPDIQPTYNLARLAAEEHRAQSAFARTLRQESCLQIFKSRNDVELRRIFDMTVPVQTLFVGFAYIQSTLMDVFAALLQQG
jgi:hypothetical protein